MAEGKEIVMVSPTGEDPFPKNPCFLKPVLPNSSFDEPFKLPQGSTSLPLPHFDPENWPLKLSFHGWRPNHQDLQAWVSHLAPAHQCTWKKAGIFDAIYNSTYQIKKEKDLVCGFAEKWCCETNTFVFAWGEATITLEDVMVLGGFSVLGDSIFSSLESRELREVEAKLEKERMGLYDYSVGCRIVTTDLWMQKFMKSESELEHEAFLVFWLSRYVFHNTSSSVNKAVISIATRLARGIRVALAPAVLAHIYKDLSVLKMTIASFNGLKDRNEIVQVTVMSPFHLVQVWAWERFVELRPISNVISCAEPRLARWSKVEGLNVGNVRKVLDTAGEGFIWRPYAMDIKDYVFPEYHVEMEKWVLVGPDLDDENGLMSFAMFLSVSKLVGFGTKQNYFPHRVAMQFGFNQTLPCSSVAGHGQILYNDKWYIPPMVSKADTMKYLKRGKQSVSHKRQKSIPLKKIPKRATEVSKDLNEANDGILALAQAADKEKVCVDDAVRDRGKGTTNIAIRLEKLAVIGADSRISYPEAAGLVLDTETKFRRLTPKILATMAGNVSECKRTWEIMEKHISENLLEGAEPISVRELGQIGRDIERSDKIGDCECFIVGVQNERPEIQHLTDEYDKEIMNRWKNLVEIERFEAIGSGEEYAWDVLEEELTDPERVLSLEEAVDLVDYGLLKSALGDPHTGPPFRVLVVNSEGIVEKSKNNIVDLYVRFYDRFIDIEQITIFVFYVPEVDEKTLRKKLGGIERIAEEGHKLAQLEGKYYIHRVVFAEEEYTKLLLNEAKRVPRSKRPPFSDWPHFKLLNVGKKIYVARQRKEMLMSLKLAEE